MALAIEIIVKWDPDMLSCTQHCLCNFMLHWILSNFKEPLKPMIFGISQLIVFRFFEIRKYIIP
ncbi:hypothetical protein D3C80_2084130 [compost metagenome]